MKKLIWALMAVVFILGCKPGIPDDVIKPEKMEKILFDIHMVDGYLSTIYIPDSSKKVAAAYYNGIYKKFDTDSAQYQKSLLWYNDHATELENIYKNIQNGMIRQKKAMEIADLSIRKKQFKADSTALMKKFKTDSLAIRKKMKPDSLSKVKAQAEIVKKKRVTDSIINIKKAGSATLTPVPTAVQ